MTATTIDLSPDWLTAHVAALLEDGADIDPDESLILYGLDSLAVMKTVAALKERGIVATFEELAQAPTLNGWLALIAARRAG